MTKFRIGDIVRYQNSDCFGKVTGDADIEGRIPVDWYGLHSYKYRPEKMTLVYRDANVDKPQKEFEVYEVSTQGYETNRRVVSATSAEKAVELWASKFDFHRSDGTVIPVKVGWTTDYGYATADFEVDLKVKYTVR